MKAIEENLYKLVSLMIFFSGIILALIGLHNLDISFNMELAGDSWNHDIATDGKVRDSTDIQIIGTKQIIAGLLMMASSYSLAIAFNIFKPNNG